jgi:hypothetical protein
MAAWPPRRLLRLGKIQDVDAIGFLKVVGDDENAMRSAQILGDVATIAAVAPRQPCPRAAGEFSVADMQSRLDQSKKWLMAHRKATARGSGFQVRVADFPRHLVFPSCTAETRRSNTGPIYGETQR